MPFRSYDLCCSLSAGRTGDVTANQCRDAGVRPRNPTRLHRSASVSLAHAGPGCSGGFAGGRSITTDRLTFSNLEDLAAIESCDVLLVPGGGGCLAASKMTSFSRRLPGLEGPRAI